MKLMLCLISSVAFADAIFDKQVAPPKARALWAVTQDIDTPESVYYDAGTDIFYVSNVAGAPDQKDGKGWISKITVSKEGKATNTKWVEGLDAPKGMRVHNGTLWVSNITSLVGIDLKDGKKTEIPIEGAKFLNDVAVAPDGRVFVSDTLSSSIYVVKDGKAEIFMQGKELESPNGLVVDGNKLLVAAWGLTTDFSTKTPGRMYSLDLKTKKKTLITKKPTANMDGLEVEGDGNYLVSDWAKGTVFRISKKGTVTLLLDGFKGAADIAYVPSKSLLVVPRMGENQISAFELTKG